ncbi:NAD(P)H-dependent flavin oxidoreductase [Streptomyces sp. NEAU-Y11]|uniref:NAD(P)H-dependent flavin oxidoreductase n=1 Tax=Streptomyces cucumeris TaxID=2962890 RepID=UPI0020C841C6|nr:nitronate monooxygenase [Streptomyces sp. NEAU-Y11]MCP9210437.1 nitronate monooxygenase [Streptomyces sp. NEAU-Y11]
MPAHPHPSSLTTPLCRRLGIDVPLVQAPIGSAVSPELVAAVSNAGGLGMLALTWTPVEEIAPTIDRVRELTDRPFGANLVLDFPIAERLDACLERRVPVISTFWADPATCSDRIHAAGAIHLHAVGSADEARHAADAGADAVVAQGWEAGGHVRGLTATLPLVPAVVDAVSPLPVIAAGGIADGRGLAAVLTLGAQAAWMGTRFLAATEARTHDIYRRRIVDAVTEEAYYTGCFDGGWPNAPHRSLRNSTLTSWEAADSPLSTRPGEGDIVALDAEGAQYLRYQDAVPLVGMTGDLDSMALYAGQSAGLVHEVLPASTIVARTVAEAKRSMMREF